MPQEEHHPKPEIKPHVISHAFALSKEVEGGRRKAFLILRFDPCSCPYAVLEGIEAAIVKAAEDGKIPAEDAQALVNQTRQLYYEQMGLPY